MEGPDDQHFLEALLEKRLSKHYEQFDIHPCQGKTSLLGSLSVEIKGSYRGLGVILDGDADPHATWQGVRDRLASASGERMQKQLQDQGTIWTLPSGLTVGVWVMPDNKSPGALESLLIGLLSQGDARLETIRACVEVADIKAHRRDKAILRAWLACRNEPVVYLSQAARDGTLPVTSKRLDDFEIWCQRMVDASIPQPPSNSHTS